MWLGAGVFEWLQVAQVADWSLPWNQKFKGQLRPVPGGSPLLSKTANTCYFVQTIFVNKPFKNAIAGGAWEWEEGSLIFLIHQGFP